MSATAGPLRPVALAILAVLLPACSVRRMAINGLADALAGSADSFAKDDDPELIRDALPFALKTIEALLEAQPEHQELLLSACSGFTQYAYAFVELDAKALEPQDYERALELRTRAWKLYTRARDYGLRALELRHPGLAARLPVEPAAAAAELDEDDVAFAFWTGAAWGSAIGLALDRPEVVADLDAVRALLRRALALDEGYEDGVIHEAMIAIEALPEAMGGSQEEARRHFARALELSHGHSAGAYVALANGVAVPNQDREEFERLLHEALALDPDAEPEARLANHVAQRHARLMLERADDLFLEPLE